MAKRRPYYLDIGTVSHGTMRTIDLLESLSDALDELLTSRVERSLIYEARRAIKAHSSNKLRHIDGADIVSALFDALDAHCPAYCYFGAIEGDGSDYGCWPIDEWTIREAIYNGDMLSVDSMPTYRELVDSGANYAIAVNDHGNMTLYGFKGRRVVELWSIV